MGKFLIFYFVKQEVKSQTTGDDIFWDEKIVHNKEGVGLLNLGDLSKSK